MNFCKDCKWCDKTTFYFECHHPNNEEAVDLVTGESRKVFIFCSTHRESNHGCTTEGKWFEPC